MRHYYGRYVFCVLADVRQDLQTHYNEQDTEKDVRWHTASSQHCHYKAPLLPPSPNAAFLRICIAAQR